MASSKNEEQLEELSEYVINLATDKLELSCLTIIGIAFFSVGSTITLLFGVYSILNPVYLISLLTDGCPESSLRGDS